VSSLISELGVCPLSSGQWGVCAPQVTPPGQSRWAGLNSLGLRV
jgi:hypothetical protein